MTKEPLGLYIHFPYCIHKCFYCDFYSIENLNSTDSFIHSLIKEIKLTAGFLGCKPIVNTIFIGGGTPSLLKPMQFDLIHNAIIENFELSDDLEWTIECNPGTIDIQNLSHFLKLNVNRLSFGIQSFDIDELKFLERIHNIEDIYKSIDTARNVGFDNINIDLMFALPNQTLNIWQNTIKKAIDLNTEHISCYSLIYEKGTPLYRQFKKGLIKQSDEDLDFELYQYAYEVFTSAGYNQYEISNYSKPNKQCIHNLNYWRQNQYYGFGPSAHSFINGKRYHNFRNLNKYIKLLSQDILPINETEILTREQSILETLYLNLRSEGINFKNFFKKYNIELYPLIKSTIDNNYKNEFLKFDKNELILNYRGLFLSDSIVLSIIEIIEENSQSDELIT